MILDLQHNKVVKDTLTDKFAQSITDSLIPKLEEKYGEELIGIQMYEDYVSDNFNVGGYWYYPMTVITEGGALTEWVSWKLDKASFKDGVPYAYVGATTLEISLADAPADFADKLEGRAIYAAPGSIGVRIDTVVPTPTFLSGKYSQTFIDEMARQLTVAICDAMSIETLSGSSIELSLVFAPETYMEHTSENVTYRRLLLVDKSSAPRDFWIKWTRLDGATAYSIADSVNADNIVFEIGEDVPQKIREKEYRCLIRLGKDKYHNAMGRKNVIEWRELIKRAIRRGELVRIETVETENTATDETLAQLAKLIGAEVPEQTVQPEVAPVSDEFELALKKLAEQTLAEESVEDETLLEEPVEEIEQTSDDFVFAGLDIDETDEEAIDDTIEQASDIFALAEVEDSEYEEDEDSTEDEQALADVRALEPDEEPECECECECEGDESEDDAPEMISISAEEMEAKIRAELEAKIRLEYESRARAKAEEEADRLRREQEQLRQENEKLQEEMERQRRIQAQKEEEMRAEEARLRAQIEMQLRAESRERERLAEAARLAVEEQRRLEAEQARLASERAEQARRAAEEAKQREEAARAAEAEKLRREKETAKVAPIHIREDNRYTYTSKVVRLIFRRSVDPNITQRIHEIIKVTLEYYGKDKIYLKVKASVPDSQTVCLEFMRIPMEEMQLLSNIIKVLGNSGLGIAKAVVE